MKLLPTLSIIKLLLLTPTYATAAMYCQANVGKIVELRGSQSIPGGNIGDTVSFPLTSLSSVFFPYSVDNFYQSPTGYEMHASSTALPSGSQSGWYKINDFLEVKMLYNNTYTVPYGWKYVQNNASCNSWPQGSLQNFANIIQKTGVTIRVTKNLSGDSIEIPRTTLYRQHWGLSNSLSEMNPPNLNLFLYELVLSQYKITFPATCTVKSMNLNIDFGTVMVNDVDLKNVVKELIFSCDRNSKLNLKVQSTRPPSSVSGKGFFSFGTTQNNLDVDAKFGEMDADSTGKLSPPISIQKNTTVSIPITFNLKQRGVILPGVFFADGYIVIEYE